MTYVPPADLTGWFFNPDGPAASPQAPDPSQPWTSQENIATLNAWLSVVSDFGNDPALGVIGTVSGQLLADSLAPAGQAGAPEPAVLALLSAGLIVLGAMAEVRRRRIRWR
jgi:hypothetical protein